MQERTSFELVADHLSGRIRSALLAVPLRDRGDVSEIRVNSGRATALVYPNRIAYLTGSGITASAKNTAAVIAMPEDIAAAVDSMSRYSIHSCERQMRDGCFVLGGGVRVGMSGAYNSDGLLTEITGLNFRISRNIAGCAVEIFRAAESDSRGILICGGVNSGKTTLLRDLCRLMGDRRKVTLVDERNEIAFSRNGVIENDVGTLTNVLTGCTRAFGIVSAVRTLSPDAIFCDEIATDEDANAIIGSAGCGVKFCATVHGENFSELMKRKIANDLLNAGVFGNIVVLKGAHAPGEIAEIRKMP